MIVTNGTPSVHVWVGTHSSLIPSKVLNLYIINIPLHFSAYLPIFPVFTIVLLFSFNALTREKAAATSLLECS